MILLYLLMNRLRCQINLVLLHKNCLEVGGRSSVSHGLAGKFVGKKLKTKLKDNSSTVQSILLMHFSRAKSCYDRFELICASFAFFLATKVKKYKEKMKKSSYTASIFM